MANEDLLKPLKSINESISGLRQDVQKLVGEVKKIPTAITEGVQTIQEAIQDSIRAQAELKLMDHVMEVKSVKPQIQAENEQIETEREELDERLASIGERYQEKHAELDEKARKRIRDLGSHIFAIEEEEFETGIEEPFTDQVTTSWRALQQHNADVRDERMHELRDTTGEVVQTIHDYVDRQEQLIDRIQNHRLDPDALGLSADAEHPIQIPYYVVEYEADGVTQRELVVPSRLSSEGSGWCAASLSPVDGVDRLVGGRVTDATRTGTLSEREFVDALEPYGESSLVGLSYTDAAAEAVPTDGVSVATEGGAD